MSKKIIIPLGSDTDASLGSKGHALNQMASHGLAVPAGFVITQTSEITPETLRSAIKRLGKGFGNAKNPLLLAVRSSPDGATLGTRESILNVGLNDQTVEGLADQLQSSDMAYDLYRHFIQTYAVNVLGMRHAEFEDMRAGEAPDKLVIKFKTAVERKTGQPFPQDVNEQIAKIIQAAPAQNGAVIVQAMVHGTHPAQIITTRSSSTGEVHAEGSAKLKSALTKLERHFKAPQEVTFIETHDKLWFLKARSLKASAKIELKMLVDMANEGVITRKDAIMAVDPFILDQFLHPTLDASSPHEIFATGIAASPGAVSGQVVFEAADAQQLKARGKPAILVRIETSPEDIQGMHSAVGVLTARGGLLSHAAVIARGMGKTCVVGASHLRVDYATETMMSLGSVIRKGEMITLDGSTGRIYRGVLATLKPILSGDFATILEWADAVRRMEVRANAETPSEARSARYFGAEGIGLCRTEHMFFSADRIRPMRRMILAETIEDRRTALDEILPMQRQDFIELFEIMAGLPVTIRLLDPPLHEFLPKSEHDILELAAELHIAPEYLRARVAELQEFNPMLGHRGVRLAVSYPEIAEMQARAIFEATADVAIKYGKAPIPEIMIPLVVGKLELDFVRAHIVAVAEEVQRESGLELPYLVGTMIELPRAALRAAEIAQSAEFFSFGTNDLTQTTLGISRDDSARFIGEYTAKGLMKNDPFISLDIEGVGELLRIAVDRGRKSRADLKLGICGEHAGDPDSINFCETIKLDYVSCSPFRIAIARLAAAQASIRNK